jgi:hypothetical protein
MGRPKQSEQTQVRRTPIARQLWRVSLALGLLAGGYAYGVLAQRNGLFPQPQLGELFWRLRGVEEAQSWNFTEGRRFHAMPESLRARELDDEELAEEFRRLEALGYVGGSQRAPATDGVGRYDPDRAQPGLNLIHDGSAPWAGLMDMSGRLLHRWEYRFEDAFPESEAAETVTSLGTLGNYRRVALLPDGALLAIFEGWGLIKLDRDSNLVWAYDGKAHHDLEVQADGSIYVLTRRSELVPRINPHRPLLHDFVVVLDANGTEVRRVSILEALERSAYSSLIELSAKEGDLFHTNTIEVLDGRLEAELPSFRAGNVLLSLRDVNALVVLDMESEEIVWAMAGLFKAQHQPTVLDNGHLLVFDNLGLGEHSRVLEIDPVEQRIVWKYDAPDFFSEYCGSNQRLPNGNSLITESDPGRAFEVDPAGEIVWEYISPHRFGANQEMIASIFEVIRLPESAVQSWLPEASR